MSDFKPNHICKNPNCTKGEDGKRKHYYACNYCTRTQNWRSVACSWECFIEYQNAVIESRTKNKELSTFPERTDMTPEELKVLMSKPIETVAEETKRELEEYIDKDGSINLSESIKIINEKIEKTTSARTKRRGNAK